MHLFEISADEARKYDLGQLPTMKNAEATMEFGFEGFGFVPQMPCINCMDGTTLSVQAGSMLYATPRSNKGPYSAVEVGFPSEPPPSTWGEYSDGNSGVWGFVPIELVHFFIAGHGGIDYDKTFSAATAV